MGAEVLTVELDVGLVGLAVLLTYPEVLLCGVLEDRPVVLLI